MAIPAPRPGAAALVTGASSGIGEAAARQLAARGHAVILVARRRDRLEALAGELAVRTEVLPCDVADAGARAELLAALDALDLDVDVAVLSAGFGMGGPFLEHDPDRVVQMLRTNLESTVVLAHHLLGGMVARRSGALLLVSSMAGHQPMPHFTPYAASKAAVTSFAEALSGEVGSKGVTVTALCPGNVRTEFATVAEMGGAEDAMPSAITIDADACARAGLDGLEAGRRIVMPKPAVRALARFGRYAPRRVWLPFCRWMMSQ